VIKNENSFEKYNVASTNFFISIFTSEKRASDLFLQPIYRVIIKLKTKKSETTKEYIVHNAGT